MMIIVKTLIISTLSSCNKSESLPPPPPKPSITLYLTAYHLPVNKFENVIPPGYANYSVKVYLVTNDKDIPIDQPIQYMNGWVGATISATDVTISYGGSAPYLNIKIVIE